MKPATYAASTTFGICAAGFVHGLLPEATIAGRAMACGLTAAAFPLALGLISWLRRKPNVPR